MRSMGVLMMMGRVPQLSMNNDVVGACLQRSPKPLQVVGYLYPTGDQMGKREEQYRVEVTELAYRHAVRCIKRGGGSNLKKDAALFYWFRPGLTIPS